MTSSWENNTTVTSCSVLPLQRWMHWNCSVNCIDIALFIWIWRHDTNSANCVHQRPYYRQLSNIRRTKSQNLNVSRLVLQLAVCITLKPGVKSRMKKQLEQRRQAMLQLHLSDKKIHCVLSATYIRDLTVLVESLTKGQVESVFLSYLHHKTVGKHCIIWRFEIQNIACFTISSKISLFLPTCLTFWLTLNPIQCCCAWTNVSKINTRESCFVHYSRTSAWVLESPSSRPPKLERAQPNHRSLSCIGIFVSECKTKSNTKKESRDYVYIMWEYKVLSIKNRCRAKSIREGKNRQNLCNIWKH